MIPPKVLNLKILSERLAEVEKRLTALENYARLDIATQKKSLSATEAQVLKLIATGHSKIAIQSQLRISDYQYNRARGMLHRKLYTDGNPTQLIFAARKLGIVMDEVETGKYKKEND